MKIKYSAPTPKRWRQLGDALLGISTMIIPLALTNHIWIGITLFAIGVVGKFITNFFAE